MSALRKIIILTDGYNDAHTAKTAICVIRYRPEEVVAVLDRAAAGKTCEELLGVGGDDSRASARWPTRRRPTRC